MSTHQQKRKYRSSATSSSDETVKETLESIVIAFILAFVFRAYVVEAFVIPTGSMAPTLLGRHLNLECPQCGHRYRVDVPSANDESATLREDLTVVCEMCHYPQTLRRGTRISAGDRILVHKYIYSLIEPRRWDVVVFKAPHVPQMNFIKRLVGLPSEDIFIIEGNIYTKPIGAGEDGWGAARKTERPRVQAAVWQPVYHQRFVPLDGGTSSPGRSRYPWASPWKPDTPDRWGELTRRGYRCNSDQPSVLKFAFETAAMGGPGSYVYNLSRAPRTYNQVERWSWSYEPIEDVRVAARVVPDRPGLSMTLRTTARVDDPAGRVMQVVAAIDRSGVVTVSTVNPDSQTARQLGDPVTIRPIEAGKSTQVELWYVDQEISVWVDQERVFVWAFELPLDVLKNRRAPEGTPRIAIEFAGSPVLVSSLEVDRDAYYSGQSPNGAAARGGLLKSPKGPRGDPFRIEADQFFCLGDNSPLSHDSRYWNKLDPWIERRMFDNDEPHELKLGIVPRKLMLGRAFFVYFPAPLRLTPTAPGVVPNFGDMRFIH